MGFHFSFKVFFLVLAYLLAVEIPVSIASGPHKQKTTLSKKEKTDFWSRAQNLKKKMFREDQEDSSHLSNPILIKEMPSIKPESLPCEFQPNIRSMGGFLTECKW